eukprot:TRINITY_DN39489_c0_g1_i1.p1 TRINITY_DN39489_c0_g1~~TRINITY_DN39489_c0_g1_i1.p1  ORF type:complete len:463 (-),score=38.77 TRINITY_DN39489_c0_g1_i1:43-1323(-)
MNGTRHHPEPETIISYKSSINIISGIFKFFKPITTKSLKETIYYRHIKDFNHIFNIREPSSLTLSFVTYQGHRKTLEDGAIIGKIIDEVYVSWNRPAGPSSKKTEKIKPLNKQTTEGEDLILVCETTQCNGHKEKKKQKVDKPCTSPADSELNECKPLIELIQPPANTELLISEEAHSKPFNARCCFLSLVEQTTTNNKPFFLYSEKVKALEKDFLLEKESLIGDIETEDDVVCYVREIIKAALCTNCTYKCLNHIRIKGQRPIITKHGSKVKPDIVVIDEIYKINLIIIEVKRGGIGNKEMQQHNEQLKAALDLQQENKVKGGTVYGIITNYHKWVFTCYWINEDKEQRLNCHTIQEGNEKTKKDVLEEVIVWIRSEIILSYEGHSLKFEQFWLINTIRIIIQIVQINYREYVPSQNRVLQATSH